MTTVLDKTESVVEGLEAGADDCIDKPFDRAELRACGYVRKPSTKSEIASLLGIRAEKEGAVAGMVRCLNHV